jgi:hypothetical protein
MRVVKLLLSHKLIVVLTASLLTLAIGLGGTKSEAIRVRLGEPSIWSLEQAHYLLESARKRNFALRDVPPDKLDPNAVNGARFDFLRTMLSVQGEFDQKVGVDNANARATAPAVDAKIASLQKDIAALNKQRDDLTAKLQLATTPDAVSVITAQRNDVDTQIAAKQADLAKLAGSKTLTSPGTGDAPNLIQPAMTDTITKLWQNLPADYRIPKLTASQQLDNHVSFGYELISKQLTQLRDEVGPGRRVVFLELPQSIDGVPGRAKDHWVQTWWKISKAWFRTTSRMAETCQAPRLADIVQDRPLAPNGAGRRALEQDRKVVRDRELVDAEAEINAEIERLRHELVEATRNAAARRQDLSLLEAQTTATAANGQRRKRDEAQRKLKEAQVEQRKADTAVHQTQESLRSAEDRKSDIPRARTDLKERETRIHRDKGLVTLKNDLQNEVNRLEKQLEEAREGFEQIKREEKTAEWNLEELKTAKTPKKDVKQDEDKDVKQAEARLARAEARSSHALKEIDKTVEELKNVRARFKKEASRDDVINAEKELRTIGREPCAEAYTTLKLEDDTVSGPVRSIELIPAKQGLTLADIHADVRQLGLSFVGKWLLGLGAKAEYNRTREKFDQFLTQQLYASSFGKGSNTFGWTFEPMPNADSLEGGVRTTYAVVAIPEDVVAIEIQGKGCYYHRSKPPLQNYSRPDSNDVICGGDEGTQSFALQIPDDSAGFFIDEIDYRPASPGQTIAVIMRGSDISPQIGVLVNGMPLQQVLALGSPNEWRDANVDPDAGIKGQFEWVNSQTLALAFRMPSDISGTPDIVLVSPAKSYSIHRFSFDKINGRELGDCRPGHGYLSDYECKMFKDVPAVTSADVVEWDGTKVYIDIQGHGFDAPIPPPPAVSRDHWFVSGKLAAEQPDKEQTRTLISVDRPNATPWTIALVASRGKEQIQSRIQVDDPFAPAVDLSSKPVTTALACEKDDDGNQVVTLMTVSVKGSFFNSSQKVDLKGSDKAKLLATNLTASAFAAQISQPSPKMVLVFNPPDKKRNSVQIPVDRPISCPE